MFSINSLTKNVSNFKVYEEKILEMTKKVGSNTIRDQLQKIDNEISITRNKKIFRSKGKKRFDFKTTLAEVEIHRRVYLINAELLETLNNNKDNWLYIAAKRRLSKGLKSIYILDELLQLKQFGKLSQGVVELIIENIVDNSCRKTANIVNKITGLNISGSAVWKTVQTLGYMLREKEKYEIEKTCNDQIESKNKKNHILFVEQDGVYFTLQGKDRQKAKENYLKIHPEVTEAPKSVRKKELKVATVYEGWEVVGKNRNKLINKKIFIQAIDNVPIKVLTNTYIKNNYDNDSLKMIVINSDGGTWTKEKTVGKCVYQLDCFHIKQIIKRQIRDKIDSDKMINLLEITDYNAMEVLTEELKYACDGEKVEIDKINILVAYIKKNKKSFRRYQTTELFKSIKQEGFIYNNLGTQEGTNFASITSRMKRRRMSFSIQGADNLSRVIAMKASHDYTDLSKAFDVQILPQRIIDEAEKYVSKIEEEIEKQKELKVSRKKIKYNESFNVSIPGIEIKSDNDILEIRNMIFN